MQNTNEHEIVPFGAEESIREKDSLFTFLTRTTNKRMVGNIRDSPEQIRRITKLIEGKKSVLQIGFQCGFSTEIMLEANPELQILSFDLGEYKASFFGDVFLTKKYPGRHLVLWGDSTRTIPNYDGKEKFDVIFIDGGHDYKTTKADILNCKRFAHKDTLLIIDDTIYVSSVAKAWKEAIEKKIVEEWENEDYGIPSKVCGGKGMSWGKYNVDAKGLG